VVSKRFRDSTISDRGAQYNFFLMDIYPVVSAYVTEEKLMDLYEHATTEAHDALVIDSTSSKIIFKKNFNIILKFE
jgi:hypothetical protein